jgi:Ulp1 protease family, C-terminal catalytic domain
VQDTSDDPCNQESMEIVMKSENRERVLQLISTSLDNILYAAQKWDFRFDDIIHAPRKHYPCFHENIRALLKRWNNMNEDLSFPVEDENEDEEEDEEEEKELVKNGPPTQQASSSPPAMPSQPPSATSGSAEQMDVVGKEEPSTTPPAMPSKLASKTSGSAETVDVGEEVNQSSTTLASLSLASKASVSAEPASKASISAEAASKASVSAEPALKTSGSAESVDVDDVDEDEDENEDEDDDDDDDEAIVSKTDAMRETLMNTKASLQQKASEANISAEKMVVEEEGNQQYSKPPASTVLLPAVSSVTSVADIFSKSDYDQVKIAADNLFLQFSEYTDYQALVFCLYAQALRSHFMTREFFKSRDIYSQLNAVTSYRDHKDLFLKFADRKNSSDDVFQTLWTKKFDAWRSMENVLQHMLGDDSSITFVRNLSLPKRLPKVNMDADMLALFSESFQEGVLEALQRKSSSSSSSSAEESSSISKRDLSVIVVDFTAIDSSYNKAVGIDFPNRMQVFLEGKLYAYQTVGAIYKMINSKSGDQYSLRILSRSRCGYEYELMRISSGMSEKESINVSYIEEWDPDNPNNVNMESRKSKAESFFPVEYTVRLDPKAKKADSWTYVIEGVILSLNEGQKEGLTIADPKLQNSLSLLEPVFSCSAYVLRTREIRILSSNQEWLSDEIMTPACKTFLENGQELGIFPKDNLVVISPPSVLWDAVLKHLIEDPDGRMDKKKPALCKMDFTIEELQEGYAHSKELWEYKNIYSLPDTWFLSIINYPDNTHWMLVGMHVNKRTYFIYDPLANKGQRESVARAVKVYIDLELESFVHWAEVNKQPHNFLSTSTWMSLYCKGPTQLDNINCGVLVLIAFFRVVKFLPRNVEGENRIFSEWHCSILSAAFQKYRKELLHLLTNVREVEDPNPAAAAAAGIRSSTRGKQDEVPRPRPGCSHAGFFYFKDVLLPWLETQNNTRY